MSQPNETVPLHSVCLTCGIPVRTLVVETLSLLHYLPLQSETLAECRKIREWGCFQNSTLITLPYFPPPSKHISFDLYTSSDRTIVYRHQMVSQN